MRVRILSSLLFLSGAGALVLEVAWFRRMAQVAGATSVALAAVLSAVIGGMALGAFLWGRRADRTPRPLRLYAFLEGIVALFALASPWILTAARPLFVHLTRGLDTTPALLTAARFLLASALLAPAAICMGGTLPAMAALVRRGRRGVGSGLGLLYAFNTLGAVAGTVAAGFFLLPGLGLAGSMRAAALLSGTAAVVALVLRARPGTETSEPPAPMQPAVDRRRAIRLLALSGFVGMAAEAAFVRGLVLVFGSSTYSFTIILAVFLLGIAAGGIVGSRWTGERSLPRLATTVAWTAAFLAIGAFLLPSLPRLYVLGVATLGDGFGAGMALRAGLTAIVLLPGAVGLGIAFPLAADVAASHARGRGTGSLYAANSLASVIGSSLAVFVLVPLLGPGRAVAWAALAVGMLVLLQARRRMLWIPLLAVAWALQPPSRIDEERMVSGVFHNPWAYLYQGEVNEVAWNARRDISFLEYGAEATVSAERWYGRSSLYVDGKTVASAQSIIEVQHLALLGHLPMVLHPKPDRVLVIGLGMGTTYEAARLHDPRELTVVELEAAVGRAAASLGVRPHDLRIDDGLAFLRATETRYDVISADPIHPWVRGGGDLYTLEYFRACRDRLAPGGVVCHWLPLYQMGYEDVRAVLRTFAQVFRTSVFFSGTNLALVGTVEDAPLRAHPPRTRAGRDALEELGATNPMDLLVFGPSQAREAAGRGRILTEDALALEFSTPHHLRSPDRVRILAWVRRQWRRPAPPYGALLRAIHARNADDHAGYSEALRAAARQAPRNGFVRRYRGEAHLNYGRRLIFAGRLQEAEEHLTQAGSYLRDDPRILGVRSELAEARGDKKEAARLLRLLLDSAPDSLYLKERLARLGKG